MLRSRHHVFQIVPIFHKDPMNMSFHGNQIEDIVEIVIAKNVLLALANGTKWNVSGEF